METEKRPVLLVLNPRAGRQKGRKRLHDIVSVLQNGGFQPAIMLTTRSGDAAAYVKAYGAVCERIVCIGGDGTFSEVVNGCIEAGIETPIGYVPTGSTNDFAASLHLAKDPLAAAERIVRGDTVRVDAGRFGDRYFSYVASFGMFTRTSYATSQSLKNKLGHLAYLLAGTKELLHLPSVPLRIRVGESVFEDVYLFGAVTNSLSLGGVLKFDSERVRMNDGLLEMLLITKPQSPIELERLVHALLTGDYASSRCLTFASASSVVMDTPTVFDWTLDGEQAHGSEHICIANVPNAIRIIV